MGKVENILAEMDAEYSRHKSRFNKTLRDLQEIKELKESLKPIDEAIVDVRQKISKKREESPVRIGMGAVAAGLSTGDMQDREIEGFKEKRAHLLRLKQEKDGEIKKHEEKLKETILNKRGFIFMSAFYAGAAEALESVRISTPSPEEISELHDKIVEEYKIGKAISKSKKNVRDSGQMLGEIRACNKDFIESLKLSSQKRKEEEGTEELEEIQDTFFNELKKAFFSGALCSLECLPTHDMTGDELDEILLELEDSI